MANKEKKQVQAKVELQTNLKPSNCLLCNCVFIPPTITAKKIELVQAFAKYFDLSLTQIQSLQDKRVGFLFCDTCRLNKLTNLNRLHQKLTSVQAEISQFISNLLLSIINVNDKLSTKENPGHHGNSNGNIGHGTRTAGIIRKAISDRYKPKVILVDVKRLVNKRKREQSPEKSAAEEIEGGKYKHIKLNTGGQWTHEDKTGRLWPYHEIDGVKHGGRNLQCGTCGYTASNSTKMGEHIKATHADLNAYTCDVCGSLFPLPDQLISHLETHMEQMAVGAISCSICGMAFKTERNLQAHIVSIHQRPKPTVPCDWPECGKLFSDAKSLRRHQRRLGHSKELSEKEPGQQLKQQIQIQGQSPQQLKQQILNQGQSPQRNQAHLPQLVVPIKCDLCYRPYLTELAFAEHRAKCSGKHKFSTPCPLCPQLSRDRGRLRQHMMSKHKDKWMDHLHLFIGLKPLEEENEADSTPSVVPSI